MPRASATVTLVAVLAVSAVPVAGQVHEHGLANSNIAIAHDLPPDGRTFVGNVNHFSVVAHGDDNVPDFHQDIPWRVTLNGVTLAETTASSGHDYDGVNSFDIVFPVAGNYTVEALDGGGKAVAVFAGHVEGADSGADIQEAAMSVAVSESPSVGSPVRFTFFPTLAGAASATPVAHSDCTFEALQAGRTMFRAKTHTHEEAQEIDYTFSEVGTYSVRIVCFQAYPSPRATLFEPVLWEGQVVVAAGLPAAAPPSVSPALPSLPPPAELNAVVTAPAGAGATLVGTFDPYTVVGPETLQHLNVLAVDDDGNTIQHVDFTASLDGPLGRVFQSDTLHEYDGILEFTMRQRVPGPYTLTVTSEGASGNGELAMTYVVAPPVVPVAGVGSLAAGPVDVLLDAQPVTGTYGDWLLTAATPGGAFAHGELDVRLTAADATVPFLQTKLHTHDDGRFPLGVALPTGQPYRLDVTPFPLMANPVLPAVQSFLVEPTGGAPLASDPAAAPPEQEMPALPAALVLAALGLAAVALRRRRA